MARQVDGVSLGMIAAGGLLAYAGVKGYSVPHALQSFVQGKVPTGKPDYLITGSAPAGDAGSGPLVAGVTGISSATGAALASIALGSVGHCYHFGGAPGRDGKGCWDCSSACNYWVAVQGGLAIPGYRAGVYDGSVHGLATGDWLLWSGCITVGHRGAAAQAGDLCVWQSHMGMAIGGGRMVSAQTPDSGTQVGTIDGFMPGEFLLVRRLKAVSVSGSSAGKTVGGG